VLLRTVKIVLFGRERAARAAAARPASRAANAAEVRPAAHSSSAALPAKR
jgi:hypothetical protein